MSFLEFQKCVSKSCVVSFVSLIRTHFYVCLRNVLLRKVENKYHLVWQKNWTLTWSCVEAGIKRASEKKTVCVSMYTRPITESFPFPEELSQDTDMGPYNHHNSWAYSFFFSGSRLFGYFDSVCWVHYWGAIYFFFASLSFLTLDRLWTNEKKKIAEKVIILWL